MRRESLENLIHTGYIKEKRSRGNSKIYFPSLSKWMIGQGPQRWRQVVKEPVIHNSKSLEVVESHDISCPEWTQLKMAELVRKEEKWGERVLKIGKKKSWKWRETTWYVYTSLHWRRIRRVKNSSLGKEIGNLFFRIFSIHRCLDACL